MYLIIKLKGGKLSFPYHWIVGALLIQYWKHFFFLISREILRFCSSSIWHTVLRVKSETKGLKTCLNQLNASEGQKWESVYAKINFSGSHFTSLDPFPSNSEAEELVSSATGKVQELLTENLTNTLSFTKGCNHTSPSLTIFFYLYLIFVIFYLVFVIFSVFKLHA